VIECDPYVPPGKERSIRADAVSFETHLRESDVLSLHVPLTEESLKKMKKHALPINTSRGAVVDTKALVKALREGWIAGAPLDVQEKEPLPKEDNFFLGMDNVILTSHSPYYSDEFVIEMRRKAAEELALVIQGRKPRSPVNLRWFKSNSGL